MKSWIWGIIMLVINSALWGALFLDLITTTPSIMGWVLFVCMTILLFAYIFGVAIDIKSHIDGKVEDEKDGKNKN